MRMEESREMKIGDAMELQLAKELRTKTTMTTARIARELTSGAVKGVEGVFMRMLQYAGLTPSYERALTTIAVLDSVWVVNLHNRVF